MSEIQKKNLPVSALEEQQVHVLPNVDIDDEEYVEFRAEVEKVLADFQSAKNTLNNLIGKIDQVLADSDDEQELKSN